MVDSEPGRDTPVFRSGDPRDPGDIVPRGFLSLLEDLAPDSRPRGSGRGQLARMIADPRNPLTARVMVNRIWHYLFGRGIVPTVDNLGRFGEPPSHSELLDFLADRFVQQGWSIKKMIRHIVLSQTFRQSSKAQSGTEQADPTNRLYHRYPARRLDAESIRDSILAVSGTLDRTLYGPSVHPYRAKPKEYRRLFAGPLDGNGRRSIYVKVTRHEGSALLEVLDFPKPSMARGRARRNKCSPPSSGPAQRSVRPRRGPRVGPHADCRVERVGADPAANDVSGCARKTSHATRSPTGSNP